MVHIRRGALLHDIGKIGIPDTILLKPERLDDGDWEIMRQHPVYAYDLLKTILYLHPALDIPRYHHERWDGSGYPKGLIGEEISLYTRTFAIVDVYDALTSDRPYRRAWNRERAQTGRRPTFAEPTQHIIVRLRLREVTQGPVGTVGRSVVACQHPTRRQYVAMPRLGTLTQSRNALGC